MRRDNDTLAWIDALRGVAVMLVIASHAMPVLAGLPWAVKRVSNLGFFGVQLFFVVSCFTLARSWRAHETAGPPSLIDFACRRVFRIVPAYFLAALLYARLLPHAPAGALRLVTFLTFTGGWSPGQMPTVPGAWVGVPGGWSIEAEMSFYVLFPWLMRGLRGAGMAACAALASLPLSWLAEGAGRAVWTPLYGQAATEQFLFYWLPNQLPVFLIGLAAFELCLLCGPGQRRAWLGAWLGRQAGWVLAASAALFLSLAWSGAPRVPEPSWAFIDTPALAALAFGGAVLALNFGRFRDFGRFGWAGWRLLTGLGQASFSAYLLHFAVIEAVRALLPSRVAGLTGVAACVGSLGVFACVLAATAGLSRLTYRLVERPAMRLGAHVSRRWGAAGPAALAKR